LVFVSTAGMWKENRASGDVSLQSRVFCFDACGGPQTENFDVRDFLEFLAHTYPSVCLLSSASQRHFKRSRETALPAQTASLWKVANSGLITTQAVQPLYSDEN